MKPSFSQKKRSHYDRCSRTSEVITEHDKKIRYKSSTNVWHKNGIMLCLQQHTFNFHGEPTQWRSLYMQQLMIHYW